MSCDLPRRPVPEPIYVPMPRNNYGDSEAANMAETNTTNINAGIRANYEFANQRFGSENYGTILRWDIYNQREIPLYSMALYEIGLSRQAFEEFCHQLRSTYDNSYQKIDWTATILSLVFPPLALCLILCGLFPVRGDNNKIAKSMAAAIYEINRRLQADSVPVAFAFKVHMQLRLVLPEVTVQYVPL
ncbi:hypothetical protein BDV38DRAFT_276942 [Aspergillus pseudotamarii]|uniref:Uncharacterized protein n=1 Tax=Aspergillus pseudotamarii TaxID=132259 RepID=A0A5N6TC15_ASPPS|nr:uncharacterized protein BDV38DRAFT_276942 [Aspergillus pseudotamarii]KAE8143873.1 hypothetical protein BDV38DRAFT_276942 [Aspergillus pseudotamarii]